MMESITLVVIGVSACALPLAFLKYVGLRVQRAEKTLTPFSEVTVP